jgi:hypothetical protein
MNTVRKDVLQNVRYCITKEAIQLTDSLFEISDKGLDALLNKWRDKRDAPHGPQFYVLHFVDGKTYRHVCWRPELRSVHGLPAAGHQVPFFLDPTMYVAVYLETNTANVLVKGGGKAGFYLNGVSYQIDTYSDWERDAVITLNAALPKHEGEVQ